MAETNPPIGRLRWPVWIANRVQEASGTSSLTESLTKIMLVHADIQSLSPMTFVGAQQTDRPITHRIIIRWLDWVDMTQVIVRMTLRLDQTDRTEVFRIRRMAEVQGRKRFLELLVEQEFRE